MNDELGRLWNEEAVAYLGTVSALSWKYWGQSLSRLGFELGTPKRYKSDMHSLYLTRWSNGNSTIEQITLPNGRYRFQRDLRSRPSATPIHSTLSYLFNDAFCQSQVLPSGLLPWNFSTKILYVCLIHFLVPLSGVKICLLTYLTTERLNILKYGVQLLEK